MENKIETTKWCIKITEENREDVGRLFNGSSIVRRLLKYDYDYAKETKNGKYLHYPPCENHKCCEFTEVIDGYKVISTEEFLDMLNEYRKGLTVYFEKEFKPIDLSKDDEDEELKIRYPELYAKFKKEKDDYIKQLNADLEQKERVAEIINSIDDPILENAIDQLKI